MENEINLKISSSLPVISGNFDDLRNQITLELKQYDFIVSEDDVKVARKMATSINKLKGEIAKKRKEIISDLTAPLKEFEKQAKELETICETSRQGLLSQTKVFEDEQKVKVRKFLEEELQAIYIKYGVKDEFKTVTVEDLVIASNLTKTGVAKKARTAIDERVLACKQLQEKIYTRLLTLDTICSKGGLNIPLTRENISHFLMLENEDEYLKKLVSLINNEVTRIEEANKVKEIIINKKQKVIQEKPFVKVEPLQDTSKYSHFKNVQEFTPVSRKTTYVVSATFEVTVGDKMASNLEKLLLQKFADSDFKQVPEIEVHKKLHIA